MAAPFEFPQPKDPDADIRVTFDWSNWLPPGETIATTVWDVPGDFTFVDLSTPTAGVLLLSGGRNGRTYSIMQRITTSSSPAQKADRTAVIRVADR